MKCPHCNQEHPDGYQFCPITGKKMEENSYKFNPKKAISSVEDFRHGNIVIDGIILGRSPIVDLKRIDSSWEYSDDNSFRLWDDDCVSASGGLTEESIGRILSVSKQYDSQLLSKLMDRVREFDLYDCDKIPFLKETGLYKWNELETEELVELVESNGYLRIEPPVYNKEWEEKVTDVALEFISKEPNAYGDYIILSFIEFGPLSIQVSIMREWTTYYDGVRHTIQ